MAGIFGGDSGADKQGSTEYQPVSSAGAWAMKLQGRRMTPAPVNPNMVPITVDDAQQKETILKRLEQIKTELTTNRFAIDQSPTTKLEEEERNLKEELKQVEQRIAARNLA